jgi:hypothetical protein
LDLKPRPGVGEDLVVDVKEGLPIEYISGIEILGQFEYEEIMEKNFRYTKLLY